MAKATNSVTVYFSDAALLQFVKERADEQGRSISNYIERLAWMARKDALEPVRADGQQLDAFAKASKRKVRK
jgi:hypothetical protein